MSHSRTFRGVVTDYEEVAEGGAIRTTYTVTRPAEPRSVPRFKIGDVVTITMTWADDAPEAIADSITDRYSNALSALAKDGEDEQTS